MAQINSQIRIIWSNCSPIAANCRISMCPEKPEKNDNGQVVLARREYVRPPLIFGYKHPWNRNIRR